MSASAQPHLTLLSSALADILLRTQTAHFSLQTDVTNAYTAHIHYLSEVYTQTVYDIDLVYQYVEFSLQTVKQEIDSAYYSGSSLFSPEAKAFIEGASHINPKTFAVVDLQTELFRRTPVVAKRIENEGQQSFAKAMSTAQCKSANCAACNALLAALGCAPAARRQAENPTGLVPSQSQKVVWTCQMCGYEYNHTSFTKCQNQKCGIDKQGVNPPPKAPPIIELTPIQPARLPLPIPKPSPPVVRIPAPGMRTCETCTLDYKTGKKKCPVCGAANPDAPAEEAKEEAKAIPIPRLTVRRWTCAQCDYPSNRVSSTACMKCGEAQPPNNP